jgi:hypothetical protein
MFPSMPKGGNAGHCVVIDVKGDQYAQYWT